ncbi:Alpha/Beta hydrolase protein, partial [Hypoxylon crocopeplum]
MAPLWSLEPFRTIYTVLFGLITIIHLSFLSLCYVFRSLRPVPQWSFQTSLGAAILRAYFRYLAVIRFQRPPQLKPGRSGERFVLIDPPDLGLFQGALAPTTTKPTPVGAVWHPAPVERNSPEPNRKVVLFAAGGALVLGWDPEETVCTVSEVLTRNFAATNVLYIQYRLASPESPFPAAVQDLLTGYQYVLSLGVSPKDIILIGDSAGANVILAFLRYLQSARTTLPHPGGTVIFSPNDARRLIRSDLMLYL